MTIYDFRTFPKPPPQLDEDIEAHILYLKREIDDKPYPSRKKREFHGIRHVTRAMILGISSVNLMRYLGFSDPLNPRLLKLIKIALLLHDSGREGDEEDLWDSDSATNVYNYLKQIPGVTEEEARITAEAMRNKDCFGGKTYYRMQVSPAGAVTWENLPLHENSLSTQHLAMSFSMQFGDCVDIIRAVEQFNDHYLIFSREVVQNDTDKEYILSQILIEERRMLAMQGDLFNYHDLKLQGKYEQADLHQRMCSDLLSNCPYLALLYANGNLLENSQAQQLKLPPRKEFMLDQGATADNILAAMESGKLMFRMVPTPSAVVSKSRTKNLVETNVELELRKTYRRLGEPTNSGDFEKEGNLARSMTMGGYGVPLMSCSGFFTFHRNAADICSVSHVDAWTPIANKLLETIISPEKAEADRLTLLAQMKRGGRTSELNELEYNIKQFDGIIYTQDPVAFYGSHPDQITGTKIRYTKPLHPATAILEAYFDQITFNNNYQRKLPIFCHSSVNHTVEVKHFSEDEIVQLWCDAVKIWLVKSFTEDIKNNPEYPLQKNGWQYTIDELKIYALYSPHIIKWREQILPLDCYYSPALKDKLNQALLETRNKTIAYLKSAVCAKDSILQDMPLSNIAYTFLADQELLQNEIDSVQEIIDNADQSSIEVNHG